MGSLQKEEVPEYLRGENQWETPVNTQLYNAASEGDVEQLRDALEKGANPNFISKSGDQLATLHAVARSLSENGGICAKELITSGARVSLRTLSDRNEAIHEAANVGAAEICEVLIDNSTKCTQAENAFGNTALHAATRSGSVPVVKLLLDKGADANKTNHRGSSALHIACFLASSSSSSSSSSSEDGDAAEDDPFLMIAANLLCSEDTDVDIADVNGYTPLHIAAQRGATEMVKLLIDSGASLTAKTSVDSRGRGGRTPAGMAKFGGQDGTLQIIEAAQDRKDVATRQVAKKILARAKTH